MPRQLFSLFFVNFEFPIWIILGLTCIAETQGKPWYILSSKKFKADYFIFVLGLVWSNFAHQEVQGRLCYNLCSKECPVKYLIHHAVRVMKQNKSCLYNFCAARNPRQVANEGLAFSRNVVRLTDLRDDDDLAAEEAAAQGGMPGYCSDRYFRAAAGGQYCNKFDNSRSKWGNMIQNVYVGFTIYKNSMTLIQEKWLIIFM